MKMKLLVVCAFCLIALAGCSKSEDAPPIDVNTAKAQPGANTPPVQAPVGGPSQAQLRADKAGK